jgi:hypothetical protein
VASGNNRSESRINVRRLSRFDGGALSAKAVQAAARTGAIRVRIPTSPAPINSGPGTGARKDTAPAPSAFASRPARRRSVTGPAPRGSYFRDRSLARWQWPRRRIRRQRDGGPNGGNRQPNAPAPSASASRPARRRAAAGPARGTATAPRCHRPRAHTETDAGTLEQQHSRALDGMNRAQDGDNLDAWARGAKGFAFDYGSVTRWMTPPRRPEADGEGSRAASPPRTRDSALCPAWDRPRHPRTGAPRPRPVASRHAS